MKRARFGEEQIIEVLKEAEAGTKVAEFAYNRERPHSSLGNLTPEEFAAKYQRSSAGARTAWPAAEQELAGAVQRAPASDPKPDSFSATLRLRRVARKTYEKMHQTAADAKLRMGYRKG